MSQKSEIPFVYILAQGGQAVQFAMLRYDRTKGMYPAIHRGSSVKEVRRIYGHCKQSKTVTDINILDDLFYSFLDVPSFGCAYKERTSFASAHRKTISLEQAEEQVQALDAYLVLCWDLDRSALLVSAGSLLRPDCVLPLDMDESLAAAVFDSALSIGFGLGTDELDLRRSFVEPWKKIQDCLQDEEPGQALRDAAKADILRDKVWVETREQGVGESLLSKDEEGAGASDIKAHIPRCWGGVQEDVLTFFCLDNSPPVFCTGLSSASYFNNEMWEDKTNRGRSAIVRTMRHNMMVDAPSGDEYSSLRQLARACRVLYLIAERANPMRKADEDAEKHKVKFVPRDPVQETELDLLTWAARALIAEIGGPSEKLLFRKCHALASKNTLLRDLDERTAPYCHLPGKQRSEGFELVLRGSFGSNDWMGANYADIIPWLDDALPGLLQNKNTFQDGFGTWTQVLGVGQKVYTRAPFQTNILVTEVTDCSDAGPELACGLSVQEDEVQVFTRIQAAQAALGQELDRTFLDADELLTLETYQQESIPLTDFVAKANDAVREKLACMSIPKGWTAILAVYQGLKIGLACEPADGDRNEQRCRLYEEALHRDISGAFASLS